MANDGASLEARGVNSSGTGFSTAGPVTEAGMVKQYLKAGTADTSSTNTIGPADTFSQVTLGGPVLHIIGTVPPGKAGLALVDGTVQNATNLLCNNNPLGNTLPSTASQVVPSVVQSGVPAVNVAQVTTAELSLSPEHE